MDETTNGGANRTENLVALGADVAGAAVPFATGAGLAVRAADDGVKVANAVADVTRGADESVTLYRAVGPNELKSIQQTGKFSLGPNGAEVKGFVRSESDAKALAKAYEAPGRPQTVVSGVAPRGLVEGAEWRKFSDVPGRSMDGIYLRGNDQLKQVCNLVICR